MRLQVFSDLHVDAATPRHIEMASDIDAVARTVTTPSTLASTSSGSSAQTATFCRMGSISGHQRKR
jgi:hypothetical protein